MQKLLTEQIDDERRKLENIAEKSEKKLDGAKGELTAKIEALLAQASGASPEVRSRNRAADEPTSAASSRSASGSSSARAELTRQALQVL